MDQVQIHILDAEAELRDLIAVGKHSHVYVGCLFSPRLCARY
jgi:hypothetical protein